MTSDDADAADEIVGSYSIGSPLLLATATAITSIGLGLIVSPTVSALRAKCHRPARAGCAVHRLEHVSERLRKTGSSESLKPRARAHQSAPDRGPAAMPGLLDDPSTGTSFGVNGETVFQVGGVSPTPGIAMLTMDLAFYRGRGAAWVNCRIRADPGTRTPGRSTRTVAREGGYAPFERITPFARLGR